MFQRPRRLELGPGVRRIGCTRAERVVQRHVRRHRDQVGDRGQDDRRRDRQHPGPITDDVNRQGRDGEQRRPDEADQEPAVQDSPVDRPHDGDERDVVHPPKPGHHGAGEAVEQAGEQSGGDGGGDQHGTSQAAHPETIHGRKSWFHVHASHVLDIDR
jgi:hypothetical protein